MASILNKIELNIRKEKEVTRRESSIFFGLIRWDVIVKEKEIGNNLEIWSCGQRIDEIYLDGKRLFYELGKN